MRVEKIMSEIDEQGCIHHLATLILHDGCDLPPLCKVQFYTEPQDLLQVGYLDYMPGDSCQRHYHPVHPRTIERTQEALIVTAGRVSIRFFDMSKKFTAVRELRAGETAILHSGGHEVDSNDGCSMIEVKLGPHQGASDKVHF